MGCCQSFFENPRGKFQQESNPLLVEQHQSLITRNENSFKENHLIRGVQPRQADQPIKLTLKEQVQEKLNRSITEMPVATDIPRMITKIKVYNQNDVVIFEADGEKPSYIHVHDFLLFLSTTLNCISIQERIKSMYYEIIPPDFEGNTEILLKRVFREIIGEKNPISAILKSINQAIIAPAIVELRLRLARKVNYKDMRNKWNVDIIIGDKGITINHLKSEEGIPNDFTFDWELSFRFDAEMKLQSTDFKIMNVQFKDSVLEATKEKITEAIQPFLM